VTLHIFTAECFTTWTLGITRPSEWSSATVTLTLDSCRSRTNSTGKVLFGLAERMAAEPEEMQIPLAQLVLWKRPKTR